LQTLQDPKQLTSGTLVGLEDGVLVGIWVTGAGVGLADGINVVGIRVGVEVTCLRQTGVMSDLVVPCSFELKWKLLPVSLQEHPQGIAPDLPSHGLS